MNRVFSISGASGALKGAAALATAAVLVGLSGCKAFDVNVGTNEPLKVDLNMEVHVYQHGETDATEEAKRTSYKDVIKARRDRAAEIQEIKDNRLVVETREGLLEIRNLPGGKWGEDVKVAVDAENADRKFLIAHEAAEKGVPEDEVRRMQWRHWQRKSFPGEWIEIESATEGEFEWVQKQGASVGGAEPIEAPKSDEKPEDSAPEPEAGDGN